MLFVITSTFVRPDLGVPNLYESVGTFGILVHDGHYHKLAAAKCRTKHIEEAQVQEEVEKRGERIKPLLCGQL